MTCSLLQLVLTGNQDLYLFFKPEFTYFKKVYIKNISFHIVTCEVKFNLPKYEVKFNLPKYEDQFLYY